MLCVWSSVADNERAHLAERLAHRLAEVVQLLGGHAVRFRQHGKYRHRLGQASDELAVHRLEPVRPAQDRICTLRKRGKTLIVCNATSECSSPR